MKERTLRADPGLHFGPTSAYEPLSGDAADRLIEAALALLRDTGVVFDSDSQAIGLFREAGCDVSSDGVVRFAPHLVRWAIESCSKSTKLWNRPGSGFIEIDNRHTWFIPGMTCIRFCDSQAEVRSSTADDLACVTRIADSLPNLDAVCVTCKDVARTEPGGEVEEFAIMASNTVKPLEFLCEDPDSLELVTEMASVVRGGREALREKPYFLQIVTPLPLNYARSHAEQVILGARAGVPVSVGTLPIGGASTPITTAGCAVQSLATDFAGMVLGQLASPGAFCIGSSDVCFMEPATGAIGNFAQTSLADMVMCQVRRRLGLPSFTGIGGQSSARRFNQDAVAEISWGMMQAFYSRPATLDYLGSVDQGLTFSLHALLLCDDLAALLRTMWQGVPIDPDTLALEEAQALGPRGNYLAHRHTASHCRDGLWSSRYFGPHLPLSTGTHADRELIERIDEDLRLRLDMPGPRPLGKALEDAMLDIVRRV